MTGPIVHTRLCCIELYVSVVVSKLWSLRHVFGEMYKVRAPTCISTMSKQDCKMHRGRCQLCRHWTPWLATHCKVTSEQGDFANTNGRKLRNKKPCDQIGALIVRGDGSRMKQSATYKYGAPLPCSRSVYLFHKSEQLRKSIDF